MATAVAASISSPSASALEAGDVIIRTGTTTVDPRESGSSATLNGSVLSLAGGTTELGVNSDTQLGLTATYMLSSHWGVELLAATPFEHVASGLGELEGLDIAETKQLPPTLSAIYYFNPQSQFKTYVGAGLNYTVFFSEDITSEADAALSGLGLTGADVNIDDSWGVSFQAGLDVQIDKQWSFNTSVRWIDIDTEANIKFDDGSRIVAGIDIDPLVYTVSVGYQF